MDASYLFSCLITVVRTSSTRFNKKWQDWTLFLTFERKPSVFTIEDDVTFGCFIYYHRGWCVLEDHGFSEVACFLWWLTIYIWIHQLHCKDPPVMASKPIPYGIQTLLQFGLLRWKGRGFSALLNCGFFFFNPSMSTSGVGMWTLGSLMLQVQRQLDSLVLVSRPCSF